MEVASVIAAKHATSTEAQTYPGYANYLWVTATIPIDGSLEGKKKFTEAY